MPNGLGVRCACWLLLVSSDTNLHRRFKCKVFKSIKHIKMRHRYYFLNQRSLLWVTGQWFILWVSTLKYSHQYGGLLSELETRTVCSCQLSKQVTSTQLADEWVEAETSKLFMDHLRLVYMNAAKTMFMLSVTPCYPKEHWWYWEFCVCDCHSHGAGGKRSECQGWTGQAGSRSRSSSWRW